MRSVRCPNCNLGWNIRDDAPADVICPRCLVRVDRPVVSQPVPIPIALLQASEPLEYQVARDTRASKVGLWFIIVLMPLGYFTAMAIAPDVRVARTILVILAFPVMLTVCSALLATRSDRSFAIGISLGLMFSFVLGIFLILVAIVVSLMTACSGMYKGL